ncbi:MAG: AzlD domain-containing protein [Ilumatobacteraceae bacterium]
MTTGVLIVLLGVGSFCLRAAPMLAASADHPRLDRVIDRAGAAALAALVATDLAGARSQGSLAAMATSLGVGLVLAHRGASMLRVIAAGVAVYAVVGALLGSG